MLMCLLQSGALQVDSSPCFRKAQNDKKETLVFKGFFCSERQLLAFKSCLSKVPKQSRLTSESELLAFKSYFRKVGLSLCKATFISI